MPNWCAMRLRVRLTETFRKSSAMPASLFLEFWHETSLEIQRLGITAPAVDRAGSGVGGAVRTTVLACGVAVGACGAVGGVTERGCCGDGGIIGRGGAACHDWGLTPVRVAGGIDIVLAGGFTLFVNILDG